MFKKKTVVKMSKPKGRKPKMVATGALQTDEDMPMVSAPSMGGSPLGGAMAGMKKGGKAKKVKDKDDDGMKKGGSAKKQAKKPVKKYKTGGHVKSEGHMEHSVVMSKAYKCGGFVTK